MKKMKKMKKIIYLFLALSLCLPVYAGSLPDVAESPPMGWNSWNWFGKQNINETIIKEVIDAMVSTGLRDAGYEYVVIDGGWRDIKLGPDGELLPHPRRFQGGIKALADYAHANGLKFGLHFVPGTHDCGGDPIGSLGREEVHLQQFIDWGVDFVKIDRCGNRESPWTEESIEEVYVRWHDLIANSGSDIVYSISAYQFRDWYPAVAHMARTTYDISARANAGAVFEDGNRNNNTFLSVMGVAELNNNYAQYAGNGYWNDPDMMVTGNGLNPDEEQSHFALWCIMSSPLMLGNDPRNISDSELEILLNEEAIAINQDPTEQGRLIRTHGPTQIWVKELQGDRYAVLLLNRDGTQPRTVSFKMQWLGNPEAASTSPISFIREYTGLEGKWRARSVFEKKDLGPVGAEFSLSTPPHGSHLLILERQEF